MERINPNLIEINSCVFMEKMRRKHGAHLTLATVPRQEWEEIAAKGFSLVWLMGVWERSMGSRKCALEEDGLRQAYDAALPGWSEEDVIGSPYAVHSYSIDRRLGSGDDLKQLRSTLHELGMALILDFVSNHLSIDHPWTESAPERFIQGGRQDLDQIPPLFSETRNGRILAHGKDPYFPAWTDTVQINHFSPDARTALTEELKKIAACADGVRCDMAMLALNDIFQKTWGKYLEGCPVPETEFWADAIHAVKSENPYFIFIAEAYWDLEYRLQQMGFDYTYDKKLYDLMLNASAGEVRAHLSGDQDFQKRCVRFIENHDEQRAAGAFGRERSCAAAAIAATIPGLHLFHEGQLEGNTIRVPIQLSRIQEEQPDSEMPDFYARLLSFTSCSPFASGIWRPLEINSAWEDNWTCVNLLAWAWNTGKSLKLICVNYSDSVAQGRIRIPHALIQAGPLTFRDVLTDEVYVRTTDEVTGGGLYVELGPWKAHLLNLLD